MLRRTKHQAQMKESDAASILQSETFWKKFERDATPSMTDIIPSLPSLEPPPLGEGATTRGAHNGGGSANESDFAADMADDSPWMIQKLKADLLECADTPHFAV
mmetsp:Transcript_60020/g.142653  ORF Transcript_60020/g.142653 Transcript_60020/m.142653 type:complete len:104 (+) Transcript_60020:227-538(+)